MNILSNIQDGAVVAALMRGEVGVVPTDTIYGLAARAKDAQAVARLYQIKHREGKPGTVVAASVDQLIDLGLNHVTLKQVAHLWPGAISIVVPANTDLAYLDQGKQSLAVRIPIHEEFRKLLEQTGPLLTSSANFPGEPPATTIQEAENCFGDSVDFYVDGGDLSDNAPSTVAQLQSDGSLLVLRQGAVSIS